MSIVRNGAILRCNHCGIDYYVSRSRVGKSRYCSKNCYDTAQTGETRDAECKKCGRKFVSCMDHGKWTVYCSRDCFETQKGLRGSIDRECETCGNIFRARRSLKVDGGYNKYCGLSCAAQAKMSGEHKDCVNCGKSFYCQRSRDDNSCCSKECASQYYSGPLANNWQGGVYVDTGSAHVMMRLNRDGFVSPYIGVHRVVAARHIGRLLRPDEPVIHIDNNPQNNAAENLFICSSRSEMGMFMHGSIPWPTKSNLWTYGRECAA